MTRGFKLTLSATAVLAIICAFGPAADSAAQSTQEALVSAPQIKLAQAKTPEQPPQKKPPPPPAATPRPPARVIAPTVAPKIAPTVAPKFDSTNAPRHVGPPAGNPNFVAPKNNFVAPKNSAGPATGAPNFAAPKTVAPVTGGPGTGAARRFGPPGTGGTAHALTLRGANRATLAGRNFSVSRSGNYRVNRGGRWRTFVGVSALGAIMFAGAMYYPYAYIDAPPDYCDGFTEDGCQLQWQEVPSLDGPPDFQCVAYCPWQ